MTGRTVDEGPSPENPSQGRGDIVDRSIKVACVAAILTNGGNRVLLQLRDDKPGLAFAGCWTLPGGRVEEREEPDDAIRREVFEELRIRPNLSLWKVYERPHVSSAEAPLTIVQYVYTGRVDEPIESLATDEGQAIEYVAASRIPQLPMAYGFDGLLLEFFSQHPPGGERWQ